MQEHFQGRFFMCHGTVLVDLTDRAGIQMVYSCILCIFLCVYIYVILLQHNNNNYPFFILLYTNEYQDRCQQTLYGCN